MHIVFVDVAKVSVLNATYFSVTLLLVKRMLNHGCSPVLFLTCHYFRHVNVHAIQGEHYLKMVIGEHGRYIIEIGGD